MNQYLTGKGGSTSFRLLSRCLKMEKWCKADISNLTALLLLLTFPLYVFCAIGVFRGGDFEIGSVLQAMDMVSVNRGRENPSLSVGAVDT